MTASTATIEETSDSGGLGKLGKVLYVVLVILVAFILYKGLYRPGSNLYWILGTAWLLLAGLGFVLFILSADYRRFGLFVWLNLALIVIFASVIQELLASNWRINQIIQGNGLLNFLFGGFFETIFWSLLLGVIAAFSLVVLPLLIFSYLAGNYLLALHEVDGVSRWGAMRHLFWPAVGVNVPYIVVETGQALITQEAGKLATIGGPGKLVVKQGNIVVLERGGTITQIVNAGVTDLRPRETIRNIFDL